MDASRVLVGTRTVVILCLLSMALPIAVYGQADSKVDPLFGSWLVNFDKSVGPPRQKSLRMTIEKDGNGRKWTVYIVDEKGVSSTRVSPANDDGKEYPVSGHAGSNSIVLKRVGPLKWEETLKKDGKPVFEGTWTLSADGKVLTIASSTREYARVYEKQ